jgi:hypothetical protein
MTVIRLLIGVLLLVLGRKLYWLFIAVLGFILGYTFSESIFPGLTNLLTVLIGILAGSLCALLAIFLNQIAITLAGFLGGGLIASQLLAYLGFIDNGFSWVPFIIGGIIGTILAAIIFDWILIIFSSIVGAFIIASTWEILSLELNLMVLVLSLVGIAIQTIHFRREQKQ